ncbi:MAG: hypothetical protein DRP42_02020 [Tenericutes bacterium]|nr:MAG: hypothetical protein DRP42_02020 [Mycoplasmatota bacterium]
MKFNFKKIFSNPKLVTIEISKYSQVKEVVTNIIDGNVVLLKLGDIQKVQAIRAMDFIAGALLATGGTYKKIDRNVFLMARSETLIKSFEELVEVASEEPKQNQPTQELTSENTVNEEENTFVQPNE